MALAIDEVTAEVTPQQLRGQAPPAAAEQSSSSPSQQRRQREQLEQLQKRACRVHAD